MGLLCTVLSVNAVDQEIKLAMQTNMTMVNAGQTPIANIYVQSFAIGAC